MYVENNRLVIHDTAGIRHELLIHSKCNMPLYHNNPYCYVLKRDMYEHLKAAMKDVLYVYGFRRLNICSADEVCVILLSLEHYEVMKNAMYDICVSRSMVIKRL